MAKERREALVRTKRLCRVGITGDDDGGEPDTEMILDEEQSILEAQTSSAVEVLKAAIAYQYVCFLMSSFQINCAYYVCLLDFV